MSRTPQNLKDFLESFVDEHTIATGEELLLDVTREDVEDLGWFFVQGLCGWMHGIRERQVDDNQREETVESLAEMSEVESELTH